MLICGFFDTITDSRQATTTTFPSPIMLPALLSPTAFSCLSASSARATTSVYLRRRPLLQAFEAITMVLQQRKTSPLSPFGYDKLRHSNSWGKVGAFVGTWVFPYIAAAGGDSDTASAQYPFYVSSSLCILSAGLTMFCLPHIGQETIQLEDRRFREYLESKGYDTQQMGLHKGESLESMGNSAHVEAPRESKQ